MHLKLSKPIMVLTLPFWSFACTQGYDLAPVVSEDQRLNGYYWEDTGRQSQNSVAGNPIASVLEQNTAGNYQKPDEKAPTTYNNDGTKGKMEFDSIQPEKKFHLVQEGETLFSIGARSGYGLEQLAMWNRIAPPYQIETGQKIRLFNPQSDDNAGLTNNSAYPAAESHHENKSNKSIFSRNKKLKTPKKPLAIAIKSENTQDQTKKKSIFSIDNQNMLMLDFQWPIKGKIEKYFSETNKKGIDIAGAIGQKVLASEAGKVVYSGQGLIGFGKLLIIKHNDDFLSAYANNSSLLVKEGQRVKKGQGIAIIGMTVSKKALLHFEIRKKGKSVNPLLFLPKK